MRPLSTRSYLIAATVLSSAFISTQALADCISQAPVNASQVVCDNPGTLGWNGAATNGLVVTVNSGSTVSSSAGGPAIISEGTGSALLNFGGSFTPGGAPTVFGIDAGTTTAAAISVGAGSIVTNDSGAAIRGTIAFGTTTGTTTNVLNNNYSTGGGVNHIGLLGGAITAGGNFTFNNLGLNNGGVIQTGAGTVVINNGIAGGYVASYSLAPAPFTNLQNGVIFGTAGAAISTVGSTSLVNNGGGAAGTVGSLIVGGVTLGTGAAGSSSLVNGSAATGNATIIGAVTLADKTNTVTNDGTITGNVALNGTGTNTYNAGSLGSSGDNGLRLPGSQVNAGGVSTGTVSGSLTGLAANSANNVLNLNGTGASTLQAGAATLNFGTVNKNDAGTWTIKNTLDGAAGKLTNVNVAAGTLSADSAAFVGSAATTAKLSNGTVLNFNGTTAGTFAGNIVDATGATTGKVTVTGANVTILSGANTYSGTTTINGGTLATGSNGSLSANSDFTVQNGGTLTVNNVVALKSLADAGAGTNTVNLNGNATSLTLSSGAFGGAGGTITGTGSLVKSGTGAFNLNGANTVNLTAPGTFQINNGAVNVAIAGAIGATTAVQVNSTTTATGILNVNFNDTIGSLAGTGANAQVNLAAGATLNTGGLNTSTAFAGAIAGAGALTKSGTGSMTLTGFNTFAGGTSITGGSIVGYAGSTAANGSLQGNIAVSGGASVGFDQSLSPNGNGSGTYAGQLSGGGFATFLGNASQTAILTLSGNNSGLTGGMNFFNNSVVKISNANNVSTGTLGFANGTLENTANVILANAVFLGSGGTLLTDAGTTLTVNGGTTGVGGLTKAGTGTLVLGGTSAHTGGTLVSAGILQGVAGVGINGAIVNNAEVDITGSAQSYAGNMSGSGKVRVFGSAVVGLMGTNTYTGATTVDLGSELYSFSTGALSNQSAFVVNGLLGMNGVAANTIGSLAGAGKVITGGGTLNVGADNTSTTFSGTFGSGGFFAGTSANVTKIGTGTLTLSGTGSALTGNLAANAGTLSLTGTLASATTTVANLATLSVDGTLTSPTVTIAAGGRLVGGLGTTPGSIVGAVSNSGTVAPGHSPGILAINGSYAQTSTGTYAADVYGNGTSTVVAGTDFDRVAVTGAPGTATLAGTLAITQNGGLYVAGSNYDVITTTGGITGNFTTVTGNVISPFITLSNLTANGAGIVGNNYRLVVVRSAYNTVAANPNQIAVATGLQALVPVAGAAATVVKIDNMTATQAQALFNTASPEPYGAYATALQDQGELFTRQVDSRLSSIAETDRTGVWLNGYGQWGAGKNRDYRIGSDHSTYGIAGGADFGMSALRLGLAIGYSEDKVSYLQGNSSGKSKSWQFGGYASYDAGKLKLDAQLAYITGNITASKLLNAGAGVTLISGTANASTNGHLFKGIATVGYDLGSENLKLLPYVGVDFASGHVNGFTETGMGVLNLTVNEIKANRTDVVAGFKFSAPMSNATPYLNAAYRYRVSNGGRPVTAFFNGLSASPFTVSSLNSGRSEVELDAGLSAKIGATASVFAGYQGTFRNDVKSHGVNGGFRYSF